MTSDTILLPPVQDRYTNSTALSLIHVRDLAHCKAFLTTDTIFMPKAAEHAVAQCQSSMTLPWAPGFSVPFHLMQCGNLRVAELLSAGQAARCSPEYQKEEHKEDDCHACDGGRCGSQNEGPVAGCTNTGRPDGTCNGRADCVMLTTKVPPATLQRSFLSTAVWQQDIRNSTSKWNAAV